MSTAAPARPSPTTTVARELRFRGGRVELVDVPLQAPGASTVRIRTEWSLVSIGTETAWIERWEREGSGGGLGYSNVGLIEEVGPGVSGWRPGMRVLTCGRHASIVDCPAAPGALVPLPDGLPGDRAAFGILGSVAYHIVERAAPRLLEPTAVIGQGVVGSLCMQLARACGADPVFAIDTDPERLAAAARLGALPVDAAREDPAARVRALTGGAGVGLAIEAAGTPKAYPAAARMLRLRGRLVVTSTVFEPVPFLILDDFIEREITVLGAHQPKCPVEDNPYYPWTQPGNRAAALRALDDGRLEVDHLISHRIRPDEAPALYERLRRHDRSIVGVAIDWRAG